MLADREAGRGAQAAARPRLRGRCVQRASEDEEPAYESQHRTTLSFVAGGAERAR